jgi:hypothetical protein
MYIDFDTLVGKILNKITFYKGDNDILYLHTDQGIYELTHDQDCCESVNLEEVIGDCKDLYGETITYAEELSNHEDNENGYESVTYTFYNLKTQHGDLTLRWLGQSNGYYSESVSFRISSGNGGNELLEDKKF